MAGILDFLNQPDAQLGIGLLAAGGPTTDPNQVGFGQRLSAGMQNMRAAQIAQAQVTENQQKAALQNVLLQNELNWQRATGLGQPQRQPGSPLPMSPPPIGGGQGGGSSPMGGSSLQVSGSVPAGGTSQPTSGGFPYVLPGKTPEESAAVAASMGRQGYMKFYAEQTAPQTDLTKLMVAANIDPKSALGQQLIQSNLAKQNYIAPVNARPGSILRDPTTNMPIAFNPHVPDNSTPIFDGSGNVVGMKPIAGADAAISAVEEAKGRGKQGATPTVVYGAGNKPVFSTGLQDLNRANGVNAAFNNLPAAQGGMTSSFQGAPEQVLPLIAGMKDPQERANAYDAYSRQLTGGGPTQGRPAPADVTPVLPPGADKGAVLSQEELSKKGTTLAADNSSANTVISRLQNIKMLAPGAITGAESSRRDFFNGLLSLANIKGAEDAKTASDLVDKNSAQIVTALRMGQGGAGTDALQTLLGAANPNRHMTVEAINDAADQLIASQKMNQAKAKILTPHVLGRDPQAYGAKELAFDQAADPRVFQLSNMNDQQAAAYIKKLSPDDAKTLMQSRAKLKELGAL